MTLRAVVVGCGFIGAGDVVPGSGIQSHAGAWSHHPGTRLVGLCDVEPARLRAASARWRGAATFTNLDQLLATTRPDIVSVATPDDTHVSVLERVLECGSVRAVLAEKPLALDVGDAERVAARAEARGVILAVNYGRRFAPSHQRLREYLAGGPIGPIELVQGTYVRGIKHNGTHWLDLARFLVGDIASVRGSGPVAPGELDPTIDVELGFVTGARGSLVGARSVRYSLFEMDLVGSGGRLRITDGGQRFEVLAPIESRRFPGFRELAPIAGPAGGLADLVMHAANDVVEALLNGRPPACGAADAIIALRLAEEAVATAQMEDRDVAPLRR